MRRIVLGIVLALAFGPLALGTVARADDAPQASVAQGALSGAHEDGVAVFKNIPFAAPPTGNLRWRPPAAPATWQGVRDATHFGPICPQEAFSPVEKRLAQSEDCLTLNVWSPDLTSAGLPVMVWIYGGGFRGGAAAFPYYDGVELAQHGVVVVTLNYRLGWLGFFDHPALENEGGPRGNYGLMDQIAALKWVKANIGAFGGDPDNVTIFGESAGGMSVNDLMVSPAARGLFEKAIAESGLGLRAIPSAEEAKAGALAFASKEGVSGTDAAALAKLRSLPVSAILAAQKGVPLDKATTPMVDGTIIPGQPALLFAQGKAAPVPYLAGSNSNEASLMQWLTTSNKSVLADVGDKLPALRKLYGTSDDAELVRELFNDSVFAGGANGLAHFVAAAGEPAYVYYFDYVPQARRGKVKGVDHGREVPFVFGLKGFREFPRAAAAIEKGTTAKDRAVLAMIQSYWTNFAKTGNPNGEGLPEWPAVTAAANHTLVVDDDTHAVAGFHKRRLRAVYRAWTKQTGIAVP